MVRVEAFIAVKSRQQWSSAKSRRAGSLDHGWVHWIFCFSKKPAKVDTIHSLLILVDGRTPLEHVRAAFKPMRRTVESNSTVGPPISVGGCVHRAADSILLLNFPL